MLGRASQVVEVPDAASGPASEAQLGDALLALVAQARENGWDAERALRERLRLLEDQVRAAESGA
jgi:XTP/dITP diphosphohydrolase